MLSRWAKILGASTAACFALATPPAGAALPKAANGSVVRQLASGLKTPTAFAFGAGMVFAADFGSEDGSKPGGVYLLENGKAKLIDGSPTHAYGLAWRNGTLYVSTGNDLLAWSHWNGSRFTRTQSIYSGPKGFTGFNGLGFGADGRLYAGVDLGYTNDHSPTSAPYAFDVLSFTAAGKDLRVVARGLRQPFQLAFPAGSSSPFVSDLGQDQPAGINPPDYVVRVRSGQNYGFPRCNWLVTSRCHSYSKPFAFLAPHSSPMGLGIIGNRLYIALFGGIGRVGPEVVSMPLAGGRVKPVLTGFADPIVALGTHDGFVYVGETSIGGGSGRVFRVKP